MLPIAEYMLEANSSMDCMNYGEHTEVQKFGTVQRFIFARA